MVGTAKKKENTEQTPLLLPDPSVKQQQQQQQYSESEEHEAIVTKDGITFPASDAKSRSVTTVQLVILLFFCVCGGPFGLEASVRGAGAGYTLLAIIVIPMFYSFPVAMLTAELSSAMPQNGGYIIWVARALNGFWGFQEGYLSCVSNIFDNALYPALFSSYLRQLFPTTSRWFDLGARLSLVAIITVVDIAGLQVVGIVSILLAVVTISPFILMALIAAPDYDPSAFVSSPPLDRVQFGILLSTVVWNNAGWDNLGNVAGSVKNPKKSYPRAMIISMLLVVAMNAVPVMVAVSVDKNTTSYDVSDGFWASLGEQLSGKWLKYMVVASSVIANCGMFLIVLTTSSWALFAMALPGLLNIPWLTQIHPRFFTPHWAIVVNALGVCCCSYLSFDSIVQVDMTMNCISMVLEVAALIMLRINEPQLARPFRIPLGVAGLCVFMAPVVVLSLGMGVTIGNFEKILVGVFLVLGIGLYYLSQWRLHGQKQVDLVAVFEALDHLDEHVPDEFIDNDADGVAGMSVRDEEEERNETAVHGVVLVVDYNSDNGGGGGGGVEYFDSSDNQQQPPSLHQARRQRTSSHHTADLALSSPASSTNGFRSGGGGLAGSATSSQRRRQQQHHHHHHGHEEEEEETFVDLLAESFTHMHTRFPAVELFHEDFVPESPLVQAVEHGASIAELLENDESLQI